SRRGGTTTSATSTRTCSGRCAWRRRLADRSVIGLLPPGGGASLDRALVGGRVPAEGLAHPPQRARGPGLITQRVDPPAESYSPSPPVTLTAPEPPPRTGPRPWMSGMVGSVVEVSS